MLLLFFKIISCETFRQNIDHTNTSAGELNEFNQHFSTMNATEDCSSFIIYICGMYSLDECTISLKTGTIKKIAKQTNSTLYFLEHRFFGKSLPFKDLSLESLEYFTIDQIVDDIGAFANYIHSYRCHNIKCNIVLVGEDYSGSIAIWAKQQYPDLIDSVWAISAPLIATNNHISLEIFHTSVLNYYFPDCMGNVSISMRSISDQFFGKNEAYIQQVYQFFGVTNETFVNDGNVLYAISLFIYDLIDKWLSSDVVPLNDFCYKLSKDNFLLNTKMALSNLSLSLNDYNPTWPTDPVDEKMRKKHLEWYLYCNELGWIPVSSPLYSIQRILPFKIQTSYVSENICHPLFNKTFEDRSYFNLRHGGTTPGTQSVIYTNDINGRNQNLLCDLHNNITNNRKEIVVMNFSDFFFSPGELEGFHENDNLTEARNELNNTLTKWLEVDKKCQHGTVYAHKCVCDDKYCGEYCDTLSRSKEYTILTTLSVVLPTFLMLSIGIIAWFIFVVSSKTTKLIC